MSLHLTLAACLLISFSAAACGQSSLTEQEKSHVIEEALARVREVYVESGDIAKIEAAIRQKAEDGEYRSAATPEAFAERLGEDLRNASGDPHFSARYSPDKIGPLPTGVRRAPETPAQRETRLHAGAVLYNNGFSRVEHLDGNVGLIVLTRIPGPDEIRGTAAAAMAFLKDTSALILDLRENRGGDPEGVVHLLSYFVEGRIHAYDFVGRKPEDTLQYFTDATVPGPRYAKDKPVFVLTSARTFSGGEAVVDAMRTWGRAKVVGERTRGGAVGALPTKAGDHFIIGVPFMKTVNQVTGKNWNVTGIEPDVAATADKAQDVAYGLALESIVANTPSAAFRERVQAILQKLKAKP